MIYLKMMAALVVAVALNTAYGSPLAFGHFIVVKSESGRLIAAPHGGFDLNTDHLALRLIRRLEWSGVTATDFRTKDHPINVNRPTEGFGLGPAKERHTEDARIVFEEFAKKLAAASKGDVRFYVEIHGTSRFVDEIQIATVGITPSEAAEIKRLFQYKLSELSLKFWPTIEGLDPIHYLANGAKSWGALGRFPRGLHIELPWRLRFEEMDKTIDLLADVLPKIAEMLGSDCVKRLETAAPANHLTPFRFEGEN